MQIINSIENFRFWRKKINGTLGFIPTMGALHDGHISLIKASQKKCKNTVVSIYINPLQFSPTEDLDTYPKNFENDLEILSQLKIDAIFFPNDLMMYPDFFSTMVEETKLSTVLEGKSRPTFFKGVTTVVVKLFNIVKPTHVFFGQKDAQQLLIIKKIINDLAYDIELIACPIIRDNNGLALSSRNQYLSDENKKLASLIYNSLEVGRKMLEAGERNANLRKERIIIALNKKNIFKVDYISISNVNTLSEIVDEVDGDILVSIAVFIEDIRLIDNFQFFID